MQPFSRLHQMMLEDDDYQDAIHSMIQNEEVNAEYAVAVTGDNFAEMFANMDDEYMQARSADVRDISNRLVRNLSGEEQIDWSTMEPSIIVADDLTPSETVQMDKSKILAFVTVHGSTNSHTAILARMMNIPALIGVPLELEKIHNGTRAIVDGREAVFYLDPEEEQIRQAEAAQQTEQRPRSLLAEYKGRESVTKSGRKVNVYANIGSVSDVAYVLENDAEGIGLFRSEFLYLGRDSLPDETEQFNAYRQVLQMMAGKKVIIRTLDMDKLLLRMFPSSLGGHVGNSAFQYFQQSLLNAFPAYIAGNGRIFRLSCDFINFIHIDNTAFRPFNVIIRRLNQT